MSVRGSLGRSHEEDAPKCIFSAAPSTSHHFAVGTMTRPRLLHRPTWEFSSAVSLAKPLRAATAFSRSDSGSHFHKDGVSLSILSIQLMLVPPAMAFFQSGGKTHFHKNGLELSIQQMVMPPAGASWRGLLQPFWAGFSFKELHVMQVSSKSSPRLVAYFYGQKLASKRRRKS